MFAIRGNEMWQTGNGLALLPSICMTWKYFGQFEIIYPKIMKSTGAAATLALLFLFVTVAKARPNFGWKPPCGCNQGSNEPSAISSGAQIVTYGDPCFCKESLPYSVQVPKVEQTPVESLKSYGYSVITPSKENRGRSLQLPVKIQTPIFEEDSRDPLSGRSYGVTVQHQAYSAPRRFSFDCAVQKSVQAQKVAYRPSMSISIQHAQERVQPRFGPLPIAVQTPVQEEYHIPRLTGLTAKVDRVLVPACEINGCPDCNDIPRRSPEPYFPRATSCQ